MQMSEREIEVLTIIIEDYIETATPVASRSVARKSRLGLSPASMRNAMADLTDKGFLEQPHTSAGRVPTARAFRFYIDTILDVPPISLEERKRMAALLEGAGSDLPELLRRAGRLLSTGSRQVSMVLAPRDSGMRVRRIEFMPVKDGLILVILILQGGIVRQRIVDAGEPLSADDLTSFANYLNDLVHDRTLPEVRGTISAELAGAREHLSTLCRRALSIARMTFEQDFIEEVFIDGTAHILTQPEFTDAAVMRELLRVFEERSRLLTLFDRIMDVDPESDSLRIALSGDPGLSSLDNSPSMPCDFGLITSPYAASGRTLGMVGIIGPMRMDYAKVVPMVDFMGRMLTQLLQKRF